MVDKFIDHVRLHGDKLQYADALWVQLPESPLYPLLEGRFPRPGHTYERIAGILEDFEKKQVNTLIGERRTRLGAKLSEVTLEVKREVYSQSKLQHIYQQLINWVTDDEVRRTYEEKLLLYCYERLLVTPTGETKDQEREMVMGLANGMVAINHPYKLAWDISLQWQDHKTIEEWGVDALKGYCMNFPESDLYKIITAFLTSSISPFTEAEKATESKRRSSMAQSSDESEDEDDGGVSTFVVPMTDEDRLVMLTEGITSSESTIGYRIAGQLFLHVGEYESTVEFMRKARSFITKEKARSGMTFQNTEDSFLINLGTALVYYQSPRHHAEAKSLFDKALDHDATSTPALIGVGLIYEEEEEYDQAIDFLARALQRDSGNARVRSEAAWVKALKGDWQSAKLELQDCLEQIDKKDPPKELLASTQYRLGCCLWNIDTSRQARKQKKAGTAYSYWLAALNANLSHAPTYTSLGVYYADYAKDRSRARRCFQKALELSSAEVVAAERLARSFAEDGDWDRVELVAQRIVDSGRVKPPPGSKRKGISWPFAVLGVAGLNKQEFHKAIVSFQSALRISPGDYHSWVGLGESYHSSGRYVAATKAIMNAQKLEEDSDVDLSADSWFTKYMLANIKQELGDYDESIALYQSVMETRPDEDGVILALLQTIVENAQASADKGFFGKATELASDALKLSTTTKDTVRESFNFWKAVGDALSVFTLVQSRISGLPVDSIQLLVEHVSPEAVDNLAATDKITMEPTSAHGFDLDSSSNKDLISRCVHGMIISFKQAIHVSALDRHAQAVGFYNLGWAEQRAHACLPLASRKMSSNYSKAAVRAFKRSIELEASNAEFWNALGVVTSDINPAVSQHAFVRSLHLNERSPVGWANLGILALVSGDFKMANASFTRAQSADPDYAHAWVGQGLVALMYGDAKEARSLFTHAMDISESASFTTRQYYSTSMFDHIQTAPPGLDVASLIQPLFALNQARGLRPQDLASSHLATLFLERTHDSSRAVGILESICSALEADYERTESVESLSKFALAKTDLARAYLADKSYEMATECGETALSLSSDETESELSGEQRKMARLSAHLTVGLAQYYAKNYDEALGYFEAALEESDNNPDATCLLAQVLWAQGTEDAKERARSALFEIIEGRPDHVRSVLLLGAIALLDNDEDSLEAVVEELQGLRTNEKVTTSEQSHISDVLGAIASLGVGKTTEDVISQAQNDAMLYPHLPHGWASLAAATGDEHAAQMALKVATRRIPPRGSLEGQDLAKAYAGIGKAADSQRAILAAPWEECGWLALQTATAGV